MENLAQAIPVAAHAPPRRRSLLGDIPFVAFDTETTGLQVSDRLVELAGVRFTGDADEGEWSALVHPGVSIPEAATAIHGIRDDDVRSRPSPAAVLPAFLEFIRGAALVGHNAPFDVRVLALELLRAGLPLPENPVLDTCGMARRLGLSVPNHRLNTLATTFGVRQGRGHRALEDARVARELLRAYLRDLGPAADSLVRHSLTKQELLLSFRSFASDPVPAGPLVALVRRAQAENRTLVVRERAATGAAREQQLLPRAVYCVLGNVYIEAESPGVGRVFSLRADAVVRAWVD